MNDSPGKLVTFKNLDGQVQDLINQASAIRELAYAPFSKFKVGCALLTRKGNTFVGCNVENSSYGLTICAEKSAIVKAVSSGDKDIIRLAVVADKGNEVTTPCGSCRQFIYEFANKTDIQIYCSDVHLRKILVVTISELLPWGFRLHE